LNFRLRLNASKLKASIFEEKIAKAQTLIAWNLHAHETRINSFSLNSVQEYTKLFERKFHLHFIIETCFHTLDQFLFGVSQKYMVLFRAIGF
jgi:hypothetical protein